MKTKYLPLASLVPDARNPRRHDRRNLDAILVNLRKYGQYAPLVIQAGTMRVVVGNGRLVAMLELGWDKADCLVKEMTDAEADGLVIADNRTAELATWDDRTLADMLVGLAVAGQDRTATGFAEAEIDQLLFSLQAPPADPAPAAGEQDLNERTPDVNFVAGPYRWVMAREEFDGWIELLKMSVGHDKPSILAELRKRLALDAPLPLAAPVTEEVH